MNNPNIGILGEDASAIGRGIVDPTARELYLSAAIEDGKEIVNDMPGTVALIKRINDCVVRLYDYEPFATSEELWVAASSDGFATGMSLLWELEPYVKPEQVDKAATTILPIMDGLYDSLVIGQDAEKSKIILGKYLTLGYEGAPGFEVVINEALPLQGYDPTDVESNNFVRWAGVGAYVFLEAAKAYYIDKWNNHSSDPDKDLYSLIVGDE